MVNLLTIAFHNMLETEGNFCQFHVWKLKCGEWGRFTQGLTGSLSTSQMPLPPLVQVGQQSILKFQRILQRWHEWRSVCFLPSQAVSERGHEASFSVELTGCRQSYCGKSFTAHAGPHQRTQECSPMASVIFSHTHSSVLSTMKI